MTVIVFSDLDDTLFYAHRKCQDLSGHKAATALSNGEVGAYSTPQQQALISLFTDSAVIPVTGRRTDSLNRVLMDFQGYKIASHGAIVINHQNELDPTWKLMLDNEEPQWRNLMEQLKRQLELDIERLDIDVRVRIVNDQGYACYVCVKGDPLYLKRLIAKTDNQSTESFTVHANDRNLAYLPPYASKRRAVDFLKHVFKNEDNGHITFFGFGDSLSDTGFMSMCDFQIIPSNSQISEVIR
jgi:hydroxymethylpyrimidine pyrophosphatase-like HAD family hydrolase